MGIIGELGMQLATKAAPGIFNGIFHKYQLSQQQDFTNQQVEAEKQLGIFNRANALGMWNDTNYEAQVNHMKEAGLNPSLMYGSAGQGGQTAGASAGNVSSGTAPKATEIMGLGLQSIAQLALLKAQKENIEADTANKRAQVPVAESIVPKNEAETKNIGTDTELKKSQIAINNYEAKLKDVESSIAESSKSWKLGMMNEEYNNLVANTALTKEQTAKATQEILTLQVSSALMASGIAKNNSDIEVNKAKIQEIASNIYKAMYDTIINQQNANTLEADVKAKIKEVGLKEIQTNFNTNSTEQVKQIVDVFATFGNTVSFGSISSKLGSNMPLPIGKNWPTSTTR